MKASLKDALLKALKVRFEENTRRHQGVAWGAVAARLAGNPGMLDALQEMERTGGDPDVIGHDQKADQFTFCDCSVESPKSRRSLCYDRAALDSRTLSPIMPPGAFAGWSRSRVR